MGASIAEQRQAKGPAAGHILATPFSHIAGYGVALVLHVTAVALHVVRAKIQERDFLANAPEYAASKRHTGFLWPRPG